MNTKIRSRGFCSRRKNSNKRKRRRKEKTHHEAKITLAGVISGGMMGLAGLFARPIDHEYGRWSPASAQRPAGQQAMVSGTKNPGGPSPAPVLALSLPGSRWAKILTLPRRILTMGYVQGQADAIKRQYFLRQALETQPLPTEADQGKTVHYVVPGPTVTADGRKLEPHNVTLSVTE